MRIVPSQFEFLARFIVRHLAKAGAAQFQKEEATLTAIVAGVFQKSLEEENKLNDDARKLLDQNKKKLGLSIDEERALQMIKKQLAKERGFVQ
ncbi:MAG: DUF507 family protein [Deltaproteobacteria bacterium]|nr:DUF507 family protein [Deltaproteobacteria bacterium]